VPDPASRPRPADPTEQLLAHLPLAAACLDASGRIRSSNAAAEAVLSGPDGAELSRALAGAAARAFDRGCATGELVVRLRGTAARVHLLPAPVEGAWIATLQLGEDDAQHARALGDVLAAAAGDPAGSVERAAAAACGVLHGCRVQVYAVVGDGLRLAGAARGPEAPPLDAGDEHLAAEAIATGRPAHFTRVAPGPGGGAELGARIALPLRADGATVGALVAAAPRLASGELRVLLGAATAAGVILGRARVAALEEAQRARIRELEEWIARAAESSLHREPLARLGQLAACVAHDLSSPLACLSTNLRALAGALEGGEDLPKDELRQLARDSLADVGRMSELVRRIREVRPPGGERRRFAPEEPVHEAVRVFGRGGRSACEVAVVVAPDLPEVQGTSGEVCEVLLNLLDNGADAMGGRGELRVEVAASGDGVRIRVVDRGAGIPAEVQPRIFDPWFTTKERGAGSGLGLYVCREVIQSMGGRIGFTTGPEGTVFEVTLPVARE
jgi:signal transduction histidine kinase